MIKVYIRAHRKGDGLMGKFIAWFTFGEYKHISMVFDFGEGHLRGFQSNARKGVHFFNTDTIGTKNANVFEIPVTEQKALRMLKLAEGLVGAKYDWTGIWGFIRRANRHNPSKWFCSEVAAWLCERVGYPLQRMAPYSQHPVIVAGSYRIKERPDLDER